MDRWASIPQHQGISIMTTTTSVHPDDPHSVHRTGWLRAAVLGGNDGIISVNSLIMAATTPESGPVLVAGVAALMAGAMSMAAGEYISVSSQADSENADIRREAEALAATPADEQAELAAIYRGRGLSVQTAATVARELTALDPLAAHVRDELGLSDHLAARPLQAVIASGVTFSAAAAVPLVAAAGSGRDDHGHGGGGIDPRTGDPGRARCKSRGRAAAACDAAGGGLGRIRNGDHSCGGAPLRRECLVDGFAGGTRWSKATRGSVKRPFPSEASRVFRRLLSVRRGHDERYKEQVFA
jgi:VIT1/CCC1 family predicted Fe2+/Mn2+ transporter